MSRCNEEKAKDPGVTLRTLCVSLTDVSRSFHVEPSPGQLIDAESVSPLQRQARPSLAGGAAGIGHLCQLEPSGPISSARVITNDALTKVKGASGGSAARFTLLERISARYAAVDATQWRSHVAGDPGGTFPDGE